MKALVLAATSGGVPEVGQDGSEWWPAYFEIFPRAARWIGLAAALVALVICIGLPLLLYFISAGIRHLAHLILADHRARADDRIGHGGHHPGDAVQRIGGIQRHLEDREPRAGQGGGGHALADLDALHRIDRHHRGGQIGIQLRIDRRAQTRRAVLDQHLDRRTDAVLILADGVQVILPSRDGAGIGQEEGVVADFGPIERGAVDGVSAQFDEIAVDGDGGTEHRARHGALEALAVAGSLSRNHGG